MFRSLCKRQILFTRQFGTINRGERRVVVTGIGWVTPMGNNVHDVFADQCEGKGGIRSINDESLLQLDLPVKVCAQVGTQEANPTIVPVNIKSICSRFEQYALHASYNALVDSKQPQVLEGEDSERAGVSIGCGIGCVEETAQSSAQMASRGARRVSAYSLPKMLVNLAAGHVSIQHGQKGPCHAVSTACATGSHSIGDAYRFIKYDDADIMLAGGTESGVNGLSLSLFSRIHAQTRETDPNCASRPFDKQRDGFVMSEGACTVVLEELNHALNRGARIYAEVAGYGLTGDAHHVTQPPSDGDGAFRSMKMALKNANLSPSDVQYINAHATSTPLGDSAEAAAVTRLFQNNLDNVSISSSKGALGHMLGASGAVEAAITILSVYNDVCPPTAGTSEIAPEFSHLHILTTKEKKRVDVGLTNSFGFGGSNATLVFKKYME